MGQCHFTCFATRYSVVTHYDTDCCNYVTAVTIFCIGDTGHLKEHIVKEERKTLDKHHAEATKKVS